MSEVIGSAARLLLVRHGQIDANVRQIWHGSTDSPLTERGHGQARRLAAHIADTRPEVAALYASPLQRCRATAEPLALALGLPLELDENLVEYGIGELEGESYKALMSEHRFFEQIHRDPEYAPPGGESLRSVVERMTAALTRLADRHRDEVVLAVSHGAAMGLALGHLLDGNATAWRNYHHSNCGVSELVLEPTPRLVAFDTTDHLQDEA